MLVLSRKIGQSIFIGDIEVMVTDIFQKKVRLGIRAPKDVPVHRSEVVKRIKAKQEKAKKEAEKASA
jgi:carbon storage regulator